MPFFQQSILLLSKQVLLGVLAGAVFTAVIQSSTAMTGLVIAIGYSNGITLPVAIAIILGANIGSCIMGWPAAIQSGSSAKVIIQSPAPFRKVIVRSLIAPTFGAAVRRTRKRRNHAISFRRLRTERGRKEAGVGNLQTGQILVKLAEIVEIHKVRGALNY